MATITTTTHTTTAPRPSWMTEEQFAPLAGTGRYAPRTSIATTIVGTLTAVEQVGRMQVLTIDDEVTVARAAGDEFGLTLPHRIGATVTVVSTGASQVAEYAAYSVTI